MSDLQNNTALALDMLGDIAGRLGAFGGPIGLGAVGAAALMKTAAKAIREDGREIDEILAAIRPPRKLRLPWHRDAVRPPPLPSDSAEDTKRERPSKAPKP